MKRTLTLLAMVLALAMTAMASADVEYPDAGITSPTAGEVVYEDSLYLEAKTDTGEQTDFAYAVRTGGNTEACTGGTNKAFDSGLMTDADGTWSTTLDISEWDAGNYCFVFNTRVGTTDVGEDYRPVVEFYIVDEYAKVGGNVDNAGYLMSDHFDIDLKELKGKQLSHAFEGVVGNIGEDTVGSITVNYRQLDTQCTFTPGDLALSGDDPGIDLDGLRANLTGFDGSCTDGSTTESANIFLLDKDAKSNRDAPRGAVVLRWNGNPSDSMYEIDGSPGSTGADSWVPLVNGNVEVGIR